jgi:hypothetical protein
VVRHPIYAGALAVFVGMPLLLGSWLGLAFVPLLIASVAARAAAEERMLRRNLPVKATMHAGSDSGWSRMCGGGWWPGKNIVSYCLIPK